MLAGTPSNHKIIARMMDSERKVSRHPAAIAGFLPPRRTVAHRGARNVSQSLCPAPINTDQSVGVIPR
jgi:hypothetical protein